MPGGICLRDDCRQLRDQGPLKDRVWALPPAVDMVFAWKANLSSRYHSAGLHGAYSP